ncbi:uncharacterized protein LOC123320709 [Coccinella septempunctata]|uniref:uncharacterized protein LOC123320709 n=1 Tax=Coccinella septempunctata TaxID=41139 RepID=UPI001D076672|nr:uncharacterized protein LOC123320709 [Coccinella septempunctata]
MKFLSGTLLLLSLSLDFVQPRITSYCPTPVIKNGRYRYRHRAKFVKYTCNVGFILYGDRYNNCNHGKWDGPPPKCVRPGCKKVDPPTNGLIYPSHVWAVLHFYCKSGYQLHGPDATYCDGATWSTNGPICLPSNTKPPLSCDFEKPDLCGWTHDLNHDFEWRRIQFDTPSGAMGTGPSYDHTLGEGEGGYYMYIESSSRNENDTARLVSPVYEKTTENTCFVFYYHMYGSTIGTLRAYLRMINETGNFRPSKAFFEQKGNQGDRWIRSVHLFDTIPEDYQIIIEAVRGNGYVSDIAIDDVSIVQNCSMADFEDREISTTTEAEEYSTTDFLPDDLYSCEGRCDFSDIQMGKHRTCACDENCYDRNECCPDYIDFCLLHGSTDQSTDTTFTEPPSTMETTGKPSSTITRTTTTSKPQTTTEIKQAITHQPTQTTRQHFTEPKATSNEPLTTRKTIIETITIRVTSRGTTTTTEENEIDEITDDQGFVPLWDITTDKSNEIPNYHREFPPIEDVAHLRKNTKEKIVISKLEEKESSTLPYILVSLAVVVMGLVLAAVRRRKANASIRYRSGSRGGSASDVRFLTSDELLDLNLDY